MIINKNKKENNLPLRNCYIKWRNKLEKWFFIQTYFLLTNPITLNLNKHVYV